MGVKNHTKVLMKRNKKYKIIVEKHVEAHRWCCKCDCSPIVLNIYGGKRIWTRVKFGCGEIMRINCHCLERI